MSYSLWENATTKHGIAVDEAVSALQKCIRRSKEEDAVRFAYELYITSPVLLEKVWSRLVSISVEDIGFGNLNAAVYINNLNQMRKGYPYDDVDQPMFFVHAIRILCASEKDRSTDFLKNIVIKTAAMGQVPEVPDIALDKHTRRGREMGRDSRQFYEEGCLVFPQAEVDNDYRARYGEVLKEYSPDKVEPDAFQYAIGRF
ncbi:hypothetical protein [Collinsella sp. An2]|uniref:hypothetical protein n=1 Tax=Collinsella sp. An2 TaxID=1965585 RepID=UPI000B3A415C|nr:hypothetical protein [Collinsella sp. An2]OUP09525.1 hypothetical protein B5F33_05025 [Collinsella sp. An2]